jgi:cytochrome c556
MKRHIPWIAAGLILAGFASAAVAADMTAVISARQAHYKEIGKAGKAIRDTLAMPAPDVGAIKAAAKTIDTLAPQLPSWFPAGSGPEAGVKTTAKAEIWSNSAEFKKDASVFATEAKTFDAVAAGGDVNAIRAEYANLGNTCKTCHQSFRAKD